MEKMDYKSILAMALIAIIIFALPFYQSLITANREKSAILDEVIKSDEIDENIAETRIISTNDEVIEESHYKKSKNDTAKIIEKTYQVNNDYIQLLISNIGANIEEIQLIKYKKADSSFVNLITEYNNNGFLFGFYNLKGDYIDLNNNEFQFVIEDSDTLNHELKVYTFEHNYNSTIFIKKYIFNNKSYDFTISISIKDPEKNILNNKIEFGWENGLPLTEVDESDDNMYNQVYLYTGDELAKIEAEESGISTQNFTGRVDWVINRSKYFLIGFIPKEKSNFCEAVSIKSEGKQKEKILERKYSFVYDIKVSEKESIQFKIYAGPLDHRILNKYSANIDLVVMNNGWYERIFRPISLLILPVLEWLYKYIPNYGIVIIIFSLLVKIVLHPLTKKSYESMKEMQVIQPLMNEVREKFKNDPQRMNKEMMALYKEYGINPLGGCLPVLLQMPLLFALFNVFKSTIQLRGALFIPGWISDLSRSENLFSIPFNIPMYGNEINILPILMSISMIFQSKMTMTDPKQKAMVYMMPVMMLLFFNSFPSGLNLYYTAFNVFTILQQKFITHETRPLKK